MLDKLAEIGQRLERSRGNTFGNLVSTSALINHEEEDDSSSRSTSVSGYSEHSNLDRDEEIVDNNDDNQALEDYAQPIIPNAPSCILLPFEPKNYDLKSSHFHMLPSFYGLPNEDPLVYIKEFYNVVSAGRALKRKNAQESYNIYEMLGSNAQHKDTRGATQEAIEKLNDDPSKATSSFEAPNLYKFDEEYALMEVVAVLEALKPYP
ncbi:hypothetical protein D8674_000084 [Pyrus ussuriensis x Pyrus communis]|uniref:Uncharacterized protein n=1 Tax=Pyrus ussuriensis x Pyrus communis TaxID=2448454 RepID=A0A5N5FFF9_9ROSA|nr:hypothetical protein D8674_000084 [Pyrus ussuriensis x Pyrus communis]